MLHRRASSTWCLCSDGKFNCIDSWSFYCYLITDKGLIVLISGHIRFLYNFRPVHDYFSSYETGGKGENSEKTTLHTHKQNWVCVTCDCKTDQLDSNLGRRVCM